MPKSLSLSATSLFQTFPSLNADHLTVYQRLFIIDHTIIVIMPEDPVFITHRVLYRLKILCKNIRSLPGAAIHLRYLISCPAAGHLAEAFYLPRRRAVWTNLGAYENQTEKSTRLQMLFSGQLNLEKEFIMSIRLTIHHLPDPTDLPT